MKVFIEFVRISFPAILYQISNEMNTCVLINNDEVSCMKLNAATYLVSFGPDGFDILLGSDKETKNFYIIIIIISFIFYFYFFKMSSYF